MRGLAREMVGAVMLSLEALDNRSESSEWGMLSGESGLCLTGRVRVVSVDEAISSVGDGVPDLAFLGLPVAMVK